MASFLRVSMTIDNTFLPELLELTKGHVANLEVALIGSTPVREAAPVARRGNKHRAFPGGQSAPQFVRDYARQNATFHLRRDLGQKAEAAGFNPTTIYGAVHRLAKKGVLRKTGRPGYYRHTAVPGPEASNGP